MFVVAAVELLKTLQECNLWPPIFCTASKKTLVLVLDPETRDWWRFRGTRPVQTRYGWGTVWLLHNYSRFLHRDNGLYAIAK